MLGNEFEMDVLVDYLPHRLPPQHLADTLNYVSLYYLLQQHMEQRENLLETVVYNIAHAILHQFPEAGAVSLVIRKLQPPIAGFNGSVGVRYQVKRQDL